MHTHVRAHTHINARTYTHSLAHTELKTFTHYSVVKGDKVTTVLHYVSCVPIQGLRSSNPNDLKRPALSLSRWKPQKSVKRTEMRRSNLWRTHHFRHLLLAGHRDDVSDLLK